jgi:hypothetical protein
MLRLQVNTTTPSCISIHSKVYMVKCFGKEKRKRKRKEITLPLEATGVP